MYPHERSLVEKHKDRPFALLGVNSDPKERLKSAVEREKITWRSFWDGGDTRGPIARRWNVRGWPTIYILDHKGVIRYQRVGADEKSIEKTIEDLLAEAEKPATTP